MKQARCKEMVEAPTLQTFLPCEYGVGHLSRPHLYDSRAYVRAIEDKLVLYRRALEAIAEDEMGHDCMCEDSHNVTRPCVQIAKAALQ
jgi:hypothetical protein